MQSVWCVNCRVGVIVFLSWLKFGKSEDFVLANFIQFILYSPFSQITNLPQSALQSVHIDIPDPEPHIGAGKTPKQSFHGEKREETFRRATEEDPSPGWTEQ